MGRWAVFVSGRGTNLQNFLELEASELKNNSISCVYADKDCPAIERARTFKKNVLVLSPNEEGFAEKLISFLNANEVDRIFMMGYMRILKPEFLNSWGKQIVNLHPSLLPKYKGLDAIKQAYDANDDELGVSLHEVVAEVDAGPILKQVSFHREPDWSYEKTEEQVHEHERSIVREYLKEQE